MVHEDLDDFVRDAPQFDDITMLEMILKETKPKDSAEKELRISADDKNMDSVNDFIHACLPDSCSPALINKIEADGFNQIIEEVAYTWFNRIIAIRFMEVNDYLPSHIRVLSSDTGKLEPDLVTTPFDAELEFTREIGRAHV